MSNWEKGYWLTARRRPAHSESVAQKQRAGRHRLLRHPKSFLQKPDMGSAAETSSSFLQVRLYFLSVCTPTSLFKRGLLYKMTVYPQLWALPIALSCFTAFSPQLIIIMKTTLYFFVLCFPLLNIIFRWAGIWVFFHCCIFRVQHAVGSQ